jgi:hypothetical protein
MNKLYAEKRFDDVIHVYNKLAAANVGKIINPEVYLDALVEKVPHLKKFSRYK